MNVKDVYDQFCYDLKEQRIVTPEWEDLHPNNQQAWADMLQDVTNQARNEIRKETKINELSLDEVDHLRWIFRRLYDRHDENEDVDYMRKFDKIIEKLRGNPEPITPKLSISAKIMTALPKGMQTFSNQQLADAIEKALS